MTQPFDWLAREARLEFRRGTLIVAVLARLREAKHGYCLKKVLARDGIHVDEGTLYPLLRRMATRKLIEGVRQKKQGRWRRVFSITPLGEVYLDLLTEEWRLNNALIEESVAAPVP